MINDNTEITFAQAASEDFFTLIGMQAMGDDEKQKLLEQMNETVIARVYLEVYKQLSDEDQQMIDTIPQEQVSNFLSERGFDLAEMVITDAISYRLELATMYGLATMSLVPVSSED